MVKVGDEDLDVYAFATVLPVGAPHLRDAPWLCAVRAFLLRRCRDPSARRQLAALFAGDSLGLLLNERLLNMPPELAPALWDCLRQDLDWVRAKSALAQDRETFSKVRHLLVVSPCWESGPGPGGAAAAAAAGAGAGAGADAPADASSFLHFEEALLQREATLSFTYAVADAEAAAASGGGGRARSLRAPQSRRVTVFPADALARCVDAMRARVAAAEAEARAAAPAPAPAPAAAGKRAKGRR